MKCDKVNIGLEHVAGRKALAERGKRARGGAGIERHPRARAGYYLPRDSDKRPSTSAVSSTFSLPVRDLSPLLLALLFSRHRAPNFSFLPSAAAWAREGDVTSISGSLWTRDVVYVEREREMTSREGRGMHIDARALKRVREGRLTYCGLASSPSYPSIHPSVRPSRRGWSGGSASSSSSSFALSRFFRYARFVSPARNSLDPIDRECGEQRVIYI